jgi:uncharacterized membrane protein
MAGLTALGTLHTAISLVAVIIGAIALVRHGEVPPRGALGRTYVWTTVITCVTGFGIFQHGGFGPPHALGVITLVALAVIAWTDRRSPFGRVSPYIVTVGYSLTLLFHLVPAATETLTRLPATAPVYASADDPAFNTIYAVLFLLFLGLAWLQVRRLRRQNNRSSAVFAARH